MHNQEDFFKIIWIKNATYTQMLRRWRHAAPGDPIFTGDIGKHYAEVMAEKKGQLSHEDQVRISKEIGW